MTDADERKIHVGSLSFDTDDHGLKLFFEKEIGPVEEAKVVTDRDTGVSRGFGFVTFFDKKYAEEAISKNAESHNSQTLDGRAIRVNKPRGGGRGGGGGYRGGGGGGYRGGGGYGGAGGFGGGGGYRGGGGGYRGGGGGYGGSGGYASGGYGSGSYGGGDYNSGGAGYGGGGGYYQQSGGGWQ